MDPVLGSVLVAFIGLIGAIVTAIITARASAERLIAQDRIRRLERELEDHGGDPDDV